MAAIPYLQPDIRSTPGINSPLVKAFFVAQQGAFRDGDILTLETATGVFPAPTGSMAALAGPLPGAVTFGSASTAGAPAATYYITVTYTATSNESLPSQEFVVNAQAGTTPTVTVSATGAPAAATDFAAYISTYTGGETLQQATRTTTALGSAFTAAYPLINPVGLIRAASNGTANLCLAMHDSSALYGKAPGGSGQVGFPGSLLGYWADPPALQPQFDAGQALVLSLTNGIPVEMSLKQPWSAGLLGTSVGITLDTSQQAFGTFVADTTATAAATIVDKATGVPGLTGQVGDTGARVVVVFNSTAVI